MSTSSHFYSSPTTIEETRLLSQRMSLSSFPDVSQRQSRPFRKRRRTVGPSTGLRAVTESVVKLLKNKEVSAYTDIVQDVVHDLDPNASPEEVSSIRRRSYDVINVMCAVGLIRKKKKRLFSIQSLVGVDIQEMKKERDQRVQRIREKQMLLNQLNEDYGLKCNDQENDQEETGDQSESNEFLVIHDKDAKPVVVESVTAFEASDALSFNPFDSPEPEAGRQTASFVINSDNHAFCRFQDHYHHLQYIKEEEVDDEDTIQSTYASF